ncbi:MAG: ribosome biogenesis GTPase Der [Bacteroidetes bacterium]|nr:ribosome biogenesis GTPase Der [Bacteroidota bacterium]MBU1421896.1 ribosome biogenesis GTPase Der [Bacteroidota bacterium]MBU2636726.1 ribosome biogenesis GTPase Der [Bacteroidota bacterium]
MANYIVAIIGRPNVGKSTLFNRIIGQRDAIVDETPGVTRDRHYAETEWTGKTFTLVDTGGFIPKATDIIEQAIREHAQIALEEANSIIFLCDAKEGVTHLDLEIAQILRKSNKNIHLVVNKVDSDGAEPQTAPFYQLGIGEPISLSALVGRKIGDFLDLITEKVPKREIAEKDERLRLAVVGKPNVGKSSFVNALLGYNRTIVTAIPGTTRDPIDSLLKYYGEEILLIDTAGLRRRSKIKESIEFYSTLRTIKSIERCNVALLLIDAKQGMDKQDLHIVEKIADRKRGMIICVNKWDLIEKDEHTAKVFENSLKALLRLYDYAPVIFMSALTKQRIFKVIELAKEVFQQQQHRVSTSKLNNTLLEIIKRNPPSSPSGKEIKIKHVIQVKTNPPVFSFFANEPKLIQQNYIRFLENKIRENFGYVGIPLTLNFKRK